MGGWVTSSASQKVQPWSARYKVLKTVSLTKGFPANEAAEVIEVLRLLEPNELVDITEQPADDSSSGQLRARCIAVKDKAAGWVSIRDGTSTTSLLLRPATAEELRSADEPEADDFGDAAPSTPPAKGQAPSKGGPKGGKRLWPNEAPSGGKSKGKGGPFSREGPPDKRYKGSSKGK